MNKFDHLPGPIADHYRQWESDAIEKCRNDPTVAAAGLCYVCMASLPICMCVDVCRYCGKSFGSHGCQCPGEFQSAFDHKTGERIYRPPSPDELTAIKDAARQAKAAFIRSPERRYFEKHWLCPFPSWQHDPGTQPLLARIYQHTRLREMFLGIEPTPKHYAGLWPSWWPNWARARRS